MRTFKKKVILVSCVYDIVLVSWFLIYSPVGGLLVGRVGRLEGVTQ